MSGLVVRPALPPEYDYVGRLTVAAYEADGQLVTGNRYGRVLADVAARAQATATEVLVAVDEASGQVLGGVTFVRPGSPYAELSGPGEAEFRMLAVDPAAQRRGAGEALVRACVDRAVGLGCTAVVICTRDFSAPAHRLYARFGFARTPERDWSPQPGVDLLALRLDLAPRPGADPG
jgi:ribosomal protein S18 acetylase RimI-like enzyme